MTKQNSIGRPTTNWEFKSVGTVNATKALSVSEISLQIIEIAASTAAAVNLTLPTAQALYNAMATIKAPKVGDTIPLRIFNGSIFQVALLNTVDSTNYITLALAGGNTCIIPANCLIDLKFTLASISPIKFYISGAPTALGKSIVSVTGTSKTFGLTDASTLQVCNNAATQTLTVPPNSSTAFPIGSSIDIAQIGAGQVVFAAGSGVTIISKLGNLKISSPNAGANLTKTATDTWLLVGDLSA